MLSVKILKCLSKMYDFKMANLHFIQKVKNEVYSYGKEGGIYFLRISCEGKEQAKQVMTEVDWILFLSQKGVQVTMPVASVNGRYVEQLEYEGKWYTAIVFEAAQGMTWGFYQRNIHDSESHFRLGALMGKIHRITKEYHGAIERETFEKVMVKDIFGVLDKFKEHIEFYQEGKKMVHKIICLPKLPESYGLLHNDFHAGNIAVKKGNYTLLDFDNSIWGWYSYDIAVALHNILVNINLSKQSNPYEIGQFIVKNFLTGYLSENFLDSYWLGLIPFFIRYRMFYFCCIHFDSFTQNIIDANLLVHTDLKLAKFFE